LYLTIDELVPHLRNLRDRLLPEATSDRLLATYYRLEMLPYMLMSVQDAVEQCISAQLEVMEKRSPGMSDGTGHSLLGDSDREKLSFPVDRFLESGRRCQDALIAYLSMARGIGLPGSLKKVVERIDAEEIDLGDAVNKLTSDYWSAHGKRLRDYRVLSQHFAIASSDARMFKSESGPIALYFLLPNNPEVFTAAKLKYEDPHVHAVIYVAVQFEELLSFIYQVTRHLMTSFPPKVGESGQQVRKHYVVPRTRIRTSRQEGHGAIQHADVRKNIQQSIVRNVLLFDQRHGNRHDD